MTIVALRNEPVQARSRSRLEQITAATRLAIADKGYERFTTADVAERAGCSIGTVYRYVPDRVALLDLVDPDRYVFAEARTLGPDESDDLDVVLMDGLLDVSTAVRFGLADTEPDRTDERDTIVRLIRTLQQKVVAIDAAQNAERRA